MKILKTIGIVLAGIIALLLILALFVPRQYTVSVSETIDLPKQMVFDYVAKFENQPQYSEWIKPDPNLKPVIEGTDGTLGSKMKWNSTIDDVGEGVQTITALTADRIDIDLEFIRPFKGKAKASTILKSTNENQTVLSFEFHADESYPMNLPSYIFGRKMIGEVEAKNLKNIKKILESGK